MSRIYLDNAATSWPKPDAVYDAVNDYIRNVGASAGRATYHEAHEATRLLNAVRQQIAQLWCAPRVDDIVFTSNGTDSLNLALHGILRDGDHVVTTDIEHNSVLRPLHWLSVERGVEVTHVPCDGQGVVQPDDVQQALRPNTRLLAISHASNVTGALQPVTELARIARQAEIVSLLDAAQTAGHIPIDVRELDFDLVAASGHKGLLGPLGTGVLYIRSELVPRLASHRQGGTGTQSDLDQQPEEAPHKYESGNHNLVGLAGLHAAAAYLLQETPRAIQLHERTLAATLWSAVERIPGITLVGPADAEQRVAVVSFTLAGYDPHEVAAMLEAQAGIRCRAGLHCAPRMHQSLGTIGSGGTVRLSLGHATTAEQISTASEAIDTLARAPL